MAAVDKDRLNQILSNSQLGSCQFAFCILPDFQTVLISWYNYNQDRIMYESYDISEIE